MHTCDNTHCINPEHLFAGTYLLNNRDSRDKGRHYIGEKNGGSKLTEQQVIAMKKEIKNRKENKVMAKTIQNKYGISRKQYKRIANGTSWSYLDG